jgi:hypothetical protein
MREDTLAFEVELDLEVAPVTMYCSWLQWQRLVVDSDAVVVELPAVVCARESDPILGVIRSPPRTSFCVPLIGR